MRRADYMRAGGLDASLPRAEDVALGVALESIGVQLVFSEAAHSIHLSDHTDHRTFRRRIYMHGRLETRIARRHPQNPAADPWRYAFSLPAAGRLVCVSSLVAPSFVEGRAAGSVYRLAMLVDRLGVERAAFRGVGPRVRAGLLPGDAGRGGVASALRSGRAWPSSTRQANGRESRHGVPACCGIGLRALGRAGLVMRFALVTPSYYADLERCRWLCETVERHVASHVTHYLIVDRADHALFAPLASARTRIVLKEDILRGRLSQVPFARRWWVGWGRPPVRGWIVQQIAKLFVHEIAEVDVLVCVDSGAFFVRPYDPLEMLRHEVVPLFREQNEFFRQSAAHQRWHRVSAPASWGSAPYRGLRCRLHQDAGHLATRQSDQAARPHRARLRAPVVRLARPLVDPQRIRSLRDVLRHDPRGPGGSPPHVAHRDALSLDGGASHGGGSRAPASRAIARPLPRHGQREVANPSGHRPPGVRLTLVRTNGTFSGSRATLPSGTSCGYQVRHMYAQTMTNAAAAI